LEDLADRATGDIASPQKTCGPLFVNLNPRSLPDACFDPFRQILLDCILEHWPFDAGGGVLGKAVAERRLHSVVTAANEARVTTPLIEQFLLEACAIAPDDARHASRKKFDARRFGPLIAEIPHLVGPGRMQQAMGASEAELEALARDGILQPRTRIPLVKSPWRMSDGLALVAELQARAVLVDADDKRWEKIQHAKHRSAVSVGTIIKAIREGRIRVGLLDGAEDYGGLVVERDEIDLKLKPDLPALPSSLQLAGAFGRSVGLRDGGQFLALIGPGHTPATFAIHPRFGVEMVYMTEEDVAAFHRRFLTTTTISAEFGLHRNFLRQRLAAARVSRFSPSGVDFGAIYLRADVEVALR
jgi:hypothetical protein